MRKLIAKLFPPRSIVLTGELLAPAPGQLLVLKTATVLTHDQRQAVRRLLRSRFPRIEGVLVLEGDMALSVKDAEQPSAEGGQHG